MTTQSVPYVKQDGFPEHKHNSHRRRLTAIEATPTASYTVASVQFNTNGRASEFVEGGVTTINLRRTVDGQVNS